MRIRSLVSLFFSLVCCAALLAQSSVDPDVPESGSVEEISKATTSSQFLSPWVSYLPASSSVPSPRAFYGRIMGAPGELVNSAKAYAYCRALAAASPRVRVFTIGHSEEGREIILLAISDEKGIQDLDRSKAATASLADPRKIDQPAAEKLIADSRPIYYFNAALHSDETGSTESVLELAYRLAVSDQPMIRRIRENLVVLINPVFQSRWPGQASRLVLSLSEGQKGSRHLTSSISSLLGQICFRGHQSRHPPANSGNHQSGPSHVP